MHPTGSWSGGRVQGYVWMRKEIRRKASGKIVEGMKKIESEMIFSCLVEVKVRGKERVN